MKTLFQKTQARRGTVRPAAALGLALWAFALVCGGPGSSGHAAGATTE